jgi:hypothetical protein
VSLLVCTASVYSGKVTLLYVCASIERVSILIIVLQSHAVIINLLVVTQFETCWQFDVIWWDSPYVSL